MEKNLDELYRDGDFETITMRFDKFLGRYREIFNPKTSTKKILGIARNANDLARTLRYLTHSGSPNEVHQMRCTITELFGSEELNQVIYLAFIETLKMYDPSRLVPLEKFIYNYYPYILKREVVQLAGPRQIMNDPKIVSSYDCAEIRSDRVATDTLDTVFDIELDDTWIEGSTCEEPFSILTPLERKLLVMIFAEHKTQEEIAKDMRYHFSSIKRKKNEIIEKISNRLQEIEYDWTSQ